ncbi:hypothetical protein THAOC_35733, partial [Thalassiosira oceanica]
QFQNAGEAGKSKRNSVTGNRTLVSRVTGGDTSHYTITDLPNVVKILNT